MHSVNLLSRCDKELMGSDNVTEGEAARGRR